MARCPSCKSDNGEWLLDDDKQPWCPECREAEKHRYYCLNRPPGYAQIPDLWYDYEVWMPGREVEVGDWARWVLGWVDFVKPLSHEQAWKWELMPADEKEWEAQLKWERKTL